MTNDDIPEKLEDLLQFPCEFPIKVFAGSDQELEEIVTVAVEKNLAEASELRTLTVRSSRGGRYAAVTAMLWVHSREELDAVYRELTSDTRVLMVL